MEETKMRKGKEKDSIWPPYFWGPRKHTWRYMAPDQKLWRYMAWDQITVALHGVGPNNCGATWRGTK